MRLRPRLVEYWHWRVLQQVLKHNEVAGYRVFSICVSNKQIEHWVHVGYMGRFDRLHAQPDPLLHLCSNRSILVVCRGRFNAQTKIHNADRFCFCFRLFIYFLFFRSVSDSSHYCGALSLAVAAITWQLQLLQNWFCCGKFYGNQLRKKAVLQGKPKCFLSFLTPLAILGANLHIKWRIGDVTAPNRCVPLHQQ